MIVFLFFLIFIASSSSESCQTGKCVLINHCPHLFATALRNDTKSKDHVKKSYCGTESMLFPKVCCPLDAIKYFEEGGAISHNQHATKCGLHEPDGLSDPWLALLEYQKSNGDREFGCTGVLINKKYILTAAHCFNNDKLINAYLGKFSGDPNDSLVVAVEGTTPHEDYDFDDPHQYNDIGLVRLKNKVSFKDGFVKPICIPTENTKNYKGKTLSVTGYEKKGDGAKKRDGVATVWENSECHLEYNSTEVRLRDSQLCAGGRRLHYRHSYNTDLGGVLMHVARDNSYTAVGILSLEKETYSKVYTKVASYIEWIFSNLKP